MSRHTRVIRSRGIRYGRGYFSTDDRYEQHLVYLCTHNLQVRKQRGKSRRVTARYTKYFTPVLMGRRYTKQVLFRK